MTENPKGPRPKEQKEVTVNIGGMVVGLVLIICLIWSLFKSQMNFAYLCTILLFALALFNHGINKAYK